MAAKPHSVAMHDHSVSRPPTAFEYGMDRSFRFLTFAAGILTVLLIVYIFWKIGGQAAPAMRNYGLQFLTSVEWNANTNQYGILAEIWGTLYSSLLALLFGGILGVAVAIFLTQGFLHPRLAYVFRLIVEMLAAIPSVVFGLWGIYVLIPAIRPIAKWLHETMPFIPFFSTNFNGFSLLPAVIVLSIMVLPTIAAISQDAFKAIPLKVQEAAYGMGTTKWEAIRKVMLPTASSGIFASLVLGFGRALGETMALALLIGNRQIVSLSLFSPATTLASLLASTFPEAGEIQKQALMYAAIVLLVITMAVNIIGTLIMSRTARQSVT
ncbi:phosphate ABC transporter permease subunit PstC [Martelella sp. HB161492]|uniref:phosphate ABC transporter permease subunit PstC n=1 Tax=Martelella sp. HB161492 TaxID=2720726 RepID=UPI001590D3D3|nr:phosphate ABC transporter permease subunit PstC [Martelella sp. HB161492]